MHLLLKILLISIFSIARTAFQQTAGPDKLHKALFLLPKWTCMDRSQDRLSSRIHCVQCLCRLHLGLRPDLRLDLRPDLRLDLRPDLRLHLRPDLRLHLRPDLRLDLRPDLRLDLNPDLRLDLRLHLRLDPRLDLRLEPRLHLRCPVPNLKTWSISGFPLQHRVLEYGLKNSIMLKIMDILFNF